MYDSELFQYAKLTLENCRGLRQIFTKLPPKATISIILDNRIPCSLIFHQENLLLEPTVTQDADFEFILFPESIRRLNRSSPRSVPALIKDLIGLSLAGNVNIRMRTDLKSLYIKGYAQPLVDFVKNLLKR